jgi:hypothetical protein
MLTADDMLKRGHLSLDWATGILNGENGFKGAEKNINGHYKATIAFMAGGRVREARNVAKHLHTTFWDDGDFHAVKDDPTATGLRNYRNAWVARGMHSLGRFDLAVRAADRLVSQQDATYGGFPAGQVGDAATSELDWGSTGSAVLSLMAMGRWESAIKGGDFLINMMKDQPETKGHLFLRRRMDGTLVKEEIKEGLANAYWINIGETGQIYWYLGIAMNVFSGLHLATGDKKWAEAGYNVLEYFNNCNEEIYETVSNGKVAWGLGAMYAATRDQKFAKLAQDVWAWHYNIQNSDGRWLRKGQIESLEVQPMHITLDTTLERCFYMFELSRTLDV